MQKKKFYFTKEDKRGRHRKDHLLKLRELKARRHAIKCAPINCAECNAPESSFVRSNEGDCTVCTKCGMVQQKHVLLHDKYTRSLIFNGHVGFVPIYTGYRNKNYFSERMRQFTNTEPRFTIEEENEIRHIYNLYRNKNESYWNSQKLTKRHIGRIFRTLASHINDMKYNTRLERWLQARCILSDETCAVGSQKIANRLRIMFDAISEVFHRKYKKQFSGHNIPNIDIICLVMLYNIDQKSLEKYGWYFLSKDLLSLSDSVIKNWTLARQLLHETNHFYAKYVRANQAREYVRPETLELFKSKKFSFVVPSYEVLVDISTRSGDGLMILKHTIFEKQVKLLCKSKNKMQIV